MKWVLRHEVYGNKPWDVQAEALRHSQGEDKWGHFLEMGLGKTALTLNEFATSKCEVMLVICPNSFKLDWPLAPEEWGLDLETGYWPKVKDFTKPKSRKRRLYSVNFEAARSGAKAKIMDLIRKHRTFLVIDESGECRNHQSQTARSCIDLCKEAAVVRILNGTPIVKNVMDYWPQLRMIGELDGVNPYAFRNRFAVMGGYMGKQVKGMKNEEELYKLLGRCTFRALKKDWRDLPPKIHSVVNLEMTPTQLQHYRDMMQDFYTCVNDMDVSAELVLTQMDKLRQISSCLVMQDGKHEWLEPPERNPKVRAVLDIADRPGKLILVHFYKPTGDMLLNQFIKAGMNPAVIRGQMKPEELDRNKKKFNRDASCRVIVCQQSASFRGHTLVSTAEDRASKMVFFENSFDYYQRSQMEDRNHRGEMDETCNYWDLLTSPMDKAYIGVLTGKKNMADAIDEIVKAVRKHGKR